MHQPELTPANPVKTTTRPIAENATHVNINTHAITEFARDSADNDFELPSWDAPVFPSLDTVDLPTAIDFFFIGNALNFCFYTDDGTHYRTTYLGETWDGSFGLWAALHRNLSTDTTPNLLDPADLATLTTDEFKDIFVTDTPMPLVEDRVAILNEIGAVLQNEYRDGFLDLILDADGQLYRTDKTRGVLPRLVTDFPVAFRDSYTKDGTTIWFNKRAQLAIAMVHGYTTARDHTPFKDLSNLSVFADYRLPATLHSLGILDYSDDLMTRIQNREELPAGSEYELELRACTIQACERLLDAINWHRSETVTVPELDYYLWKQRKSVDTPAHYTRTTAY